MCLIFRTIDFHSSLRLHRAWVWGICRNMNRGIRIKQENGANSQANTHRASFEVAGSCFKALVLLKLDAGAICDFLLCETELFPPRSKYTGIIQTNEELSVRTLRKFKRNELEFVFRNLHDNLQNQ